MREAVTRFLVCFRGIDGILGFWFVFTAMMRVRAVLPGRAASLTPSFRASGNLGNEKPRCYRKWLKRMTESKRVEMCRVNERINWIPALPEWQMGFLVFCFAMTSLGFGFVFTAMMGFLNCRYLPGKTASPPPSFPRRREIKWKTRCCRQWLKPGSEVKRGWKYCRGNRWSRDKLDSLLRSQWRDFRFFFVEWMGPKAVRTKNRRFRTASKNRRHDAAVLCVALQEQGLRPSRVFLSVRTQCFMYTAWPAAFDYASLSYVLLGGPHIGLRRLLDADAAEVCAAHACRSLRCRVGGRDDPRTELSR